MATYYAAVDMGASSGRLILGHMENGKMELEEIHRFENGMVKKDGELVLNVPVNAGLVGVVIAPIAAVVAVVAAFGFKCSIEIIKTDGTIIDVSDAVTDAMGSVAEKSSTVAGEVKERSTTWYQRGLEKAGEAVSKIKKAGEEVADAAEELYEESRLDGEDEDETDAPCEAADTAEGAGKTAEEQEETAEKE